MAADLTLPPTTTIAGQSVEQIAAEVERLSTIGINTINARDWNYSSTEAQDFVSHINPNQWQSKFDNEPGLLSWHEQNLVWRKLVEETYTDCHFDIVEISSSVLEQGTVAIVWIQTRITGIENVNMQGLSELRWRWHDGKWWFFHHVGIRGHLGQSGVF
ncbi:hypothetical protein Slin15195_G048670 [Septoria linicola]|uniref:Uncharacterized protein n=1 Tax=Septoria linicola TaxID=215465 RepID=A0A9Q9AR08_9PEZI|nr:hypothetical protein Slin15195_G048670 [Septoria linicola]